MNTRIMTGTAIFASLIGAFLTGIPVLAQNAGVDDIAIEVHIIGMEVDTSAASQLQAMAAAAGGTYHASDDPNSLTGALASAAGVAVVGTILQTSESEPNNSFGDPDPIAATGSISGRIAERGDADWYVITVPHQGELVATTTAVPSELDLVYRVWNVNKDTVSGWYAPSKAGGETSGVTDLPEPGRYVLEVHDGNDDAFADGEYGFQLNFTPTPDSAEPNNWFAAAQAIPFENPVNASILPRGDADWYSVSVDHQGALEVSIVDVPEDLDIVYRVWDANKDTVSGWYQPLAPGADLTGVTDLASAGTYYVEVHDGNDDARASDGYELTASFTPTADTDEPNNQFSSAQEIAFDTPIDAAILPRGDADWYAVTVDHQGELAVSIVNVPKELDIVYRVWNANKDTLTGWYMPLSKGGDLAGITDLAEPGTYFLEVRDSNDDTRDHESYELTASFTPTTDTEEPNSWFSAAQPVEIGTPVQAAILPRGDADWYVVDLPHQGALTVSVTESTPALDLIFRVWNANKDTLTGWHKPLSKGGDTVAVVDIPSPGLWAIEVRDGNDDERSPAPYTFALEFEPTADRGEPNGRFGDASAMRIDSEISANILPRGDADWYAMDIPEQGALTVEITDVDDPLDIVFRVLNADKDTVTGWYKPLSRGGPTNGVVDFARPGRYYLEVRDGNDDQRSAKPYTLTTRFEPTGDLTEASTGPDNAAALLLGQPMQAAIFPTGDRDWFSITTDLSGMLNISISSSPSELDIQFRLLDESGSAITGWQKPLNLGGDVAGKVELPAAGRYVVEVLDGNNDARATSLYSISASIN